MGLRLRRIGYAPPVVVEEEPEAQMAPPDFVPLEPDKPISLHDKINAWGASINARFEAWWRNLWD